jgi:hypothetical protein
MVLISQDQISGNMLQSEKDLRESEASVVETQHDNDAKPSTSAHLNDVPNHLTLFSALDFACRRPGEGQARAAKRGSDRS